MKVHFSILLIIFCFFSSYTFSQGSFFGGYDNDTQDLEEYTDDMYIQDLETEKPLQEDSIEEPELYTGPITLGDRVKIRVDNLFLTERQLALFFALKQISSFLNTTNSAEEVIKEMSLVLGLEAFIKQSNLYQVLPTQNEIQKRLDFLKKTTQSDTNAQLLLKIDPSGNLNIRDLRLFFYYHILREKGFVYVLQTQFINKIFTPRNDEILYLYKQILESSPQVFQSPIQLYIRNLTILEPPNENEKQKHIRLLEKLKETIKNEPKLEKKETLFIEGIQKYASSHLRNTKIVGPLDQNLIESDLPEYQGLLNLNRGDVSDIIIQDGFIRLIFIQEKNSGDNKSIDNPEIRQKVIGILYDTKGQKLFKKFLEDNLLKYDLQITQ